jgi:hypothetical protein
VCLLGTRLTSYTLKTRITIKKITLEIWQADIVGGVCCPAAQWGLLGDYWDVCEASTIVRAVAANFFFDC